ICHRLKRLEAARGRPIGQRPPPSDGRTEFPALTPKFPANSLLGCKNSLLDCTGNSCARLWNLLAISAENEKFAAIFAAVGNFSLLLASGSSRPSAVCGGSEGGSIAVEGGQPFGLPVRRERDLFDPHFGVLQEFVAALLQRFAALVEPDRIVEGHCAFLELVDDAFELGKRLLERHGGNVRIDFGHNCLHIPRASPSLAVRRAKADPSRAVGPVLTKLRPPSQRPRAQTAQMGAGIFPPSRRGGKAPRLRHRGQGGVSMLVGVPKEIKDNEFR